MFIVLMLFGTGLYMMIYLENNMEKDDIAWLSAEVDEWEKQGIIDEYRAHKILSMYGLGEALPEPKPESAEPEAVVKEEGTSRLITIVSMLGAILVGVGMILFVASNWRMIPDFLKLLLLFGTTFVTYFIGWKLKFETKSHPRVGEALLFLASAFVGATIFLTAQIFNVNTGAHWLVLLWFVAISPMGYAFNSKYILGLDIFTFALWMIMYVTGTRGLSLSEFEVFMLYLLFGISLYGLGQLHITLKKYSHFRIPYQVVGLFFILASYFYFSLESPYDRDFMEIATTSVTIQLLFIVFGMTSLVSIIGSATKYEKYRTVRHEFFVLLLAFMGWIGIWLLTFFSESLTVTTTQYGYSYNVLDPDVATILFVIFNLMLFILSIGSILIGYYKAVVPFVNLGMFFFVVGVLHLYFTTLYELLPKSLAFIAGGLILIGCGLYLEKKRQELIRGMGAYKHREGRLHG